MVISEGSGYIPAHLDHTQMNACFAPLTAPPPPCTRMEQRRRGCFDPEEEVEDEGEEEEWGRSRASLTG